MLRRYNYWDKLVGRYIKDVFICRCLVRKWGVSKWCLGETAAGASPGFVRMYFLKTNKQLTFISVRIVLLLLCYLWSKYATDHKVRLHVHVPLISKVFQNTVEQQLKLSLKLLTEVKILRSWLFVSISSCLVPLCLLFWPSVGEMRADKGSGWFEAEPAGCGEGERFSSGMRLLVRCI